MEKMYCDENKPTESELSEMIEKLLTEIERLLDIQRK